MLLCMQVIILAESYKASHRKRFYLTAVTLWAKPIMKSAERNTQDFPAMASQAEGILWVSQMEEEKCLKAGNYF